MSWGESFEQFTHSPRIIFNRSTNLSDTVTVCSIVEFHVKGPEINLPFDSACFILSVKAGIGEQKWAGYYRGEGDYVVRYGPKRSENLSYTITSSIARFREQSGELVVDNLWPRKGRKTDYFLGTHLYTDRSNPQLYDGKIQGGITVKKWRNEVLKDWAKRWVWLKEE